MFSQQKEEKKGISKDPNPDSFWIDMPFLVQIAKAKEQYPNWGAKKNLDELHVTYTKVKDTDLRENRYGRTQILVRSDSKGHISAR
jgi:hypothetical protein